MIVVLVIKQCMYKLVHVHVLSIPGSTKKIFRVLLWEVPYSDQSVNLFIGQQLFGAYFLSLLPI